MSNDHVRFSWLRSCDLCYNNLINVRGHEWFFYKIPGKCLPVFQENLIYILANVDQPDEGLVSAALFD